MTTFAELTNKPTSEKVTLVWIEPKERFLVWTLESGSVYKRDVSYFVVDILEGTTSLTQGSNSSLSSGQWWYDAENGTVYIRTSDDSNPNTKDVVGTYRLFYSNSPLNLPYDLSSGPDVEYQGRLKSTSPITKQLDEEQTGVALESNTSITLENTDGHFDEFYDVLFFENKAVRVYAWSPVLPLSEKQLLFDGTIQDKSFSTSQVQFKCKDFMYQLREPVALNLFSSSDGSIPDSFINTPKRRIYGKFDNLDCVPVSAVLDGFNLTGTIQAVAESATVTGAGTIFLDECSPEDKIKIVLANEEFELEIQSVDSDTQLTLTENVPTAFAGITAQNEPIRPYRKKNRTWYISNHKLRAPSTEVDVGTQPNRFTVLGSTDMEPGDLIEVDGQEAFIKRVSDGEIVLESNLGNGTPSNGDTVIKNPLSKAYINTREAFINRDWTVTNASDKAEIVFTNTAEFKIAKPKTIPGTISFTASSRDVTATGVNLLDYLETRDWIRSDDISHTTWYEVLSVEETSLELRVAYAGSNTSGASEIKRPELIDDDSLITVNTIGLERSNTWIKTASDTVKDLLEQDAGLSNINAASFSESDLEVPYTLSLAIPENLRGQIPKIRDVITKINKSVFGSLVTNSSQELVYNVLAPHKDEGISAVKDDDVIGEITVRSRNDVIRKVNAKYRPFVDRFTKENAFKLSEQSSQFVDTYIGNKAELDITLFLYDDDNADEIAQRYLFYNSLSSSTLSINSGYKFMLNNLNDKLWLQFDRLYKRFGNRDRKKIGLINKITKNGERVSVEINDLGNIFTRSANIADDSSSDFTVATDDEKIVSGYVVDDDLEIPDSTSDNELGQNLIA